MKQCILIFSIWFLLNSCKNSAPSGIIKQEKMQEILWDVFRADALSHQIISSDSSKSLPDETVKLTDKVFSIHNITREQFEKSYSYYTQHPEIMRTMLDSLSAQQTRINNIEMSHRSKPVIIDSIKKLIKANE